MAVVISFLLPENFDFVVSKYSTMHSTYPYCISKKYSNLFLVFHVMSNSCRFLLHISNDPIHSCTLSQSNLNLTSTGPCLLLHSRFSNHHKLLFYHNCSYKICLHVVEFLVGIGDNNILKN